VNKYFDNPGGTKLASELVTVQEIGESPSFPPA